MTERFGLLYESTFDGSMVGAGPAVFAVWSYVVAKGFGGQVVLNPRALGTILGTTVADVEAAIAFHCAPDPNSRSDAHEGRRLLHVAGYVYEIVNHDVYKNARVLEEKRAYNRAKKRASRERSSSTIEVPVFDTSKKLVTNVDPLLSSSSDLISLDPEGVQGEPVPLSPPSRFAPADYAPTEAQRARCRERRLDPAELVADFKRHEFNREYSDWERRFDKWIEDEESTAPSTAPPATAGPPWVDDEALLFAREHALDLRRESNVWAKAQPVPPRLLKPGDARAAFKQHLRERVRQPSAA